MTEFKSRTIHPSAVLYNFKELQNYFAKTGERVYLKCYPATEEIKLETAYCKYGGYGATQYRINMFGRSSGVGVDVHILQYIHDNDLLKKVSNKNLIFWYGITAGDLEQYITLEDFLIALKEYKLNGLNYSMGKTSILDEYLAEEEVDTRELVAA